ncbi:Puromycin N-acetyltransferase [Madurella fahalii]|uniref:Puromycin N-acetyltransferase n=1 Tax=Madurella fahalii TaxID=1157608 RepID=A0ABQ0FYP0_9PEZI
MTSTNPRIRVREATPADVETIIDINFEAFGDNAIDQLMYPNGVSEDCKKKFGARLLQPKPLQGKDGPVSAEQAPQTLVYVAEYVPEPGADDKPGEVVAFAKWRLNRVQQAEAEWKQDFQATSEIFGEGCDLSVIDAFICEMNRKQRDHAKGEPALYLSILACKPGRRRLGAGSALVRWGVELADELGLPCRLEASPVGYSLYKKFGYEDVDVLDTRITETWGVANTNGSNWGTNNAVALAGPAPEGVMRTVIMRRPPKKATV